jgi:hypothetical protein
MAFSVIVHKVAFDYFAGSTTLDGSAKMHQGRWLCKKPQRQGAQNLRNEAYTRYAAVAKDAAQVSVDSDAAVGEFWQRHRDSTGKEM